MLRRKETVMTLNHGSRPLSVKWDMRSSFARLSPHGYWLVGSDGGIFTFGSAPFYGSTGSLSLQRPVVGMTLTADRGGYWLVASGGGGFFFGDAGVFGSVPGLGHPP